MDTALRVIPVGDRPGAADRPRCHPAGPGPGRLLRHGRADRRQHDRPHAAQELVPRLRSSRMRTVLDQVRWAIAEAGGTVSIIQEG